MSKQNTKKPAGKRTTPVSGTSPGTGGPFGAANNARSINPTAFSHQLVPNLGTLWAETEVSAPVAGISKLHLAGHIDNVLSIGARKPLALRRGAPTARSARSAGGRSRHGWCSRWSLSAPGS